MLSVLMSLEAAAGQKNYHSNEQGETRTEGSTERILMMNQVSN
jgi:hypothetical protein